ncbi:hypothetical protein ACSQ67_011829 [Phaseolus vulgaris]
MKSNKAYLALMAFQLTCIGIMYEASNTNPFHQSTLFLLLTAIFSHVLASAADINNPITLDSRSCMVSWNCLHDKEGMILLLPLLISMRVSLPHALDILQIELAGPC